jgi:hypothetical protein
MKDCVSHALRTFRIYNYAFRSYECTSAKVEKFLPLLGKFCGREAAKPAQNSLDHSYQSY